MHFTIQGRRFDVAMVGTYQSRFRDFRIRVCRHSDGRWAAELATGLGTHWMPGWLRSPRAAAKAALEHWKDKIQESDRLDAEDSDRERREYEHDNRLRRDDVL